MKTEITQELAYLEGVKAECRDFNLKQRRHLDTLATLTSCRSKLQSLLTQLNEPPSWALRNEVEGPMLDRSNAFNIEYLELLQEAEADLQGLLDIYERVSDIRHFKHAMAVRKVLITLYRVQDGDYRQVPLLLKALDGLRGEDAVVNAFSDRVRQLYGTEE